MLPKNYSFPLPGQWPAGGLPTSFPLLGQWSANQATWLGQHLVVGYSGIKSNELTFFFHFIRISSAHACDHVKDTSHMSPKKTILGSTLLLYISNLDWLDQK